ncbi:MAG: serine/threonine-protein kinase [Candidatus Eremiobacterota bacterium]
MKIHYSSSIKKEEKNELLYLNTVLNDRYIIRGLIITTERGAVYIGEEKDTKKIYAIKELRPSLAISDEDRKYAVDKFIQEARLLRELKFTSVPEFREYFVSDGNHYIIMEFIEGLDMEDMVTATGNPGLPQETVINWGIELCNIMDYLHNYSPTLIYRDMKPGNIMIRNSDQTVVLIDFGIAIPVYEKLKCISGTKIGTMGYMAPEQFYGKVSPASDIFSLGATLYFTLTGRVQQLFNYMPLKNFITPVDDELERLIATALKDKPEERISSAAEFKQILLDIKYRLEEKNLKEKEEFIRLMNNIEDNNSMLLRIDRFIPDKTMDEITPPGKKKKSWIYRFWESIRCFLGI